MSSARSLGSDPVSDHDAMAYRAATGEISHIVRVSAGGGADPSHAAGESPSTRNQPAPTCAHGTCERVPTWFAARPTGEAADGLAVVALAEVEGTASADALPADALLADALLADALVAGVIVADALVTGEPVDAVVAGAAFGALLPQAPTRTPTIRTTIADPRAFGHVSRPLAPISFIRLPRIEGSARSDAVGP
jgi:hypothetical protein